MHRNKILLLFWGFQLFNFTQNFNERISIHIRKFTYDVCFQLLQFKKLILQYVMINLNKTEEIELQQIVSVV